MINIAWLIYPHGERRAKPIFPWQKVIKNGDEQKIRNTCVRLKLPIFWALNSMDVWTWVCEVFWQQRNCCFPSWACFLCLFLEGVFRHYRPMISQHRHLPKKSTLPYLAQITRLSCHKDINLCKKDESERKGGKNIKIFLVQEISGLKIICSATPA